MTEEVKVAASFEKQVWDVLSHVDVTEHIDKLPKTKKRPEVAYLPWHKAWMLTVRKFPASTYSHKPDITHSDGTMEVEVDVAISSDGKEFRYINARLAVMDNWFNAIPSPDARSINDSRQRCLVKALAFAGLGLSLWADGSVVPVGKLDDPIDDDQLAELERLIEETDTDKDKFLKWCECETLSELPFERYGSALGLLNAKLGRQRQAAREEAEK